MIRTLSCLTFCIGLFLFLSPHQALANQKVHQQRNDTFFSFLKNYIIAFTVIDAYNKQHVLAAETKAQVIQPTLQQTMQPTQTGQQVIAPPNDISAYILQGVNNYRISLGLSLVQSSVQTCAFAATRANEITNTFNHAGFYNRVHNHTIPYSRWARAVENIAETPNYKNVVTLWKNSPGHAANMRDNTPYVCIMQQGNYYAYEGLRS